MKRVFFPERRPDDIMPDHSGIDVWYDRRDDSIEIGGWYDSCVGIESTTMPLRDFLLKIGVQKRRVKAICPTNTGEKKCPPTQ
jgi:hypothetical protein